MQAEIDKTSKNVASNRHFISEKCMVLILQKLVFKHFQRFPSTSVIKNISLTIVHLIMDFALFYFDVKLVCFFVVVEALQHRPSLFPRQFCVVSVGS